MIKPIVRKENFRVEIEPVDKWIYGSRYDEHDAKYFAEYAETLKNIRATVIWDTFFVCPKCKFEAKNEKDLKGCCEENGEQI